VEKYGRAGQVTDDYTIRRMRIACWVTKGVHTRTHKHTHSEYVILNVFFSSATMVPLHYTVHETARHSILPRTVQKFPKISLRSLQLCSVSAVSTTHRATILKKRLRTLLIPVIIIGRHDDMW